MKESPSPAEYHGELEPEFSLSFLNHIVAGSSDTHADKHIPANDNPRFSLLDRRESSNSNYEYGPNATGSNAHDVFLISRTNTPGLDHLYSSNANSAHPNSLSNNIITATSSPYIKTPMINKSSEPLFDTPYLNQLYADYVPTSNANFASDELPSLSDISLSNIHGFRIDTPLNDKRFFKTPNKNSFSKTIISHSTLKKISGLISTPLKEVLEDCNDDNHHDGVSVTNTNKSSHARKRNQGEEGGDEDDEDDNASQADERASPCVKHQLHLNTTSISSSTTSQIFSQHSLKGDMTHDTTKLSIRSGGNGILINNTPGKELQLFSDFSSPTRKLKPLSRSTTMASHSTVTPAKIPNIKIKTPDSVNSTSSTIVIESTTKANKGIQITESIDASPTPMTKNQRFLISKNELRDNNNINNVTKEVQLPNNLNTSTPDRKQVFNKFSLPPIMGSFTQGPAIGTFKNKKVKRLIKQIPPQQPRKEFNIHMMNAGGKRKNKSNINGQQFQFVMTDMRKFTEPRNKRHNVLKESTNIINNSPKKKRRFNQDG